MLLLILIKLLKMKNFILKQVFGSKKFWYTVASIVVPLISTHLGVDEGTATNMFYAFLTLVLGQGIADIKK